MQREGLKGYLLRAKHDYNRFNLFDLPIKSLLLEMKWGLKHQHVRMFGLKLNKYE